MSVYHRFVGEVAAFVLAGGHSSRMGTNKAFLDLAGKTLLQRALELAAAVASDASIVGEVTKFMALGRVIEDVYPGHGPLGGIHAALKRTPAPLNLILAVDLPFVQPAFLKYLVSVASQNSAVVTVPQAAGGWQPLCAVYRREFLALAERALRKGKNKIDALFAEVETRAVKEEELTRMGFPRDMFRNLNTAEELKRAEEEFGEWPPVNE